MKTHLLLTITAVLMLTGCSTAQKVQTNRVPHPVELTPFNVYYLIGDVSADMKNYVKSIGYTENVTVTYDSETFEDIQIELWRADNEDGKSYVEINTHIIFFTNGEIHNCVRWVCYTWHKKKDMPKGLYEGYEYRDYQNNVVKSFLQRHDFSVNWSKYRNHYSIGTTAYNPYKPLRGSRLETPIKIQIVN